MAQVEKGKCFLIKKLQNKSNNLWVLWNTLTDISTTSKPSDKLDMLLNPEKAKQLEEDKRIAMDDLRDGRPSIITYECLQLTEL